MECRLHQQNQPWRCKVSLRRDSDENGLPITDIQEVQFGDIIHEAVDLEDRLRRAQKAILNPSIDYANFLFDEDRSDDVISLEDEQNLSFSSNVVCVDVWGPDVPDLTFIDLPGAATSCDNRVRFSTLNVSLS